MNIKKIFSGVIGILILLGLTVVMLSILDESISYSIIFNLYFIIPIILIGYITGIKVYVFFKKNNIKPLITNEKISRRELHCGLSGAIIASLLSMILPAIFGSGIGFMFFPLGLIGPGLVGYLLGKQYGRRLSNK